LVQVAALLQLTNKQQQQQQPEEALIACTAALLSAAEAMLRAENAAGEHQRARACITAGVLEPFMAALCGTATGLQAADAAVAAELAAGNGLPVQYWQRQRTVPAPVQLAMRLISLYDVMRDCWPQGLLLSDQAGKAVQPAARLLLAAMQFVLRLLAGNNRDLSCKLLGVCLKPATTAAVQADTSIDGNSEAKQQLLHSRVMQQLQLLLLTMAIKMRCQQQHVPLRLARSSDRRRQQQQLPSLDTSRHRYLLAMLRTCGLSEQQAAAAPFPEVFAAQCKPVLNPDILTAVVDHFCLCSSGTQRYLMCMSDTSGEDAFTEVDEVLFDAQPAALMLLEAAYNLSQEDARVAAQAADAALACTKSMMFRTIKDGVRREFPAATPAKDSTRVVAAAAAAAAAGSHSSTANENSSSSEAAGDNFQMAEILKLVRCVLLSALLPT
jgi:hypothetical protein